MMRCLPLHLPGVLSYESGCHIPGADRWVSLPVRQLQVRNVRDRDIRDERTEDGVDKENKGLRIVKKRERKIEKWQGELSISLQDT